MERKKFQRHNMQNTRFYNIWKKMKDRCNVNRPSAKRQPEYKYYGAKGIRVCTRWQIFLNFYDDMYKSYLAHVKQHGEKRTTIDRINGSENYYPENCRWATPAIQNRHTSRIKPFIGVNNTTGDIHFGTVIVDFAKDHNLTPSAISSCLKRKSRQHKGWSFRYNPHHRVI